MLHKIIDELAESDIPLVNPLRRILVFASRIGNDALVSWVERELKGFETGEVPEYRQTQVIARCNYRVFGIGPVHYNQPLSLGFIDDERLFKSICVYHWNEGVEILESFRHLDKDKTIRRDFPPEYCGMVTGEMRKKGYKNVITALYQDFELGHVNQILSNIRSKFLNLLLKLEREYPSLKESTPTSENQVAISQTISYYIMNNITQGDGSILNTGHGSSSVQGNNNQTNSLSGNNNVANQTLTLTPENKAEFQELLREIKEVLTLELPGKENAVEDAETIEKQLAKPEPRLDVMKFSLEGIRNYFIGLAVSLSPKIPAIMPKIQQAIDSISIAL